MPVVGDLIDGKYRLEHLLGKGGMGEVYQAVHENIGKRVAIKFLHRQYSANAKMLARFQQEAQAAAAAGHRNIVDIHDMGIADDGCPFLVMEMLAGRCLAEARRTVEQMDVATVAYVVCNVLSALSAAHAVGIIHRDLKPQNIFLVDTGAALADVKLLDFGVSRMVDRNDDTELERLTATGAVIGTPHYMSPEQARGAADVDHRTDLYSLGVILYKCLAGTLPFHAANYNAMIIKIVNTDPEPPSVHRPTIGPDLEAIIMRAMAKDRDQRYSDSAAMFYALLPYVPERAVDRVPTPLQSSVDSLHAALAARGSVAGVSSAALSPAADMPLAEIVAPFFGDEAEQPTAQAPSTEEARVAAAPTQQLSDSPDEGRIVNTLAWEGSQSEADSHVPATVISGIDNGSRRTRVWPFLALGLGAVLIGAAAVAVGTALYWSTGGETHMEPTPATDRPAPAALPSVPIPGNAVLPPADNQVQTPTPALQPTVAEPPDAGSATTDSDGGAAEEPAPVTKIQQRRPAQAPRRPVETNVQRRPDTHGQGSETTSRRRHDYGTEL